MDHQPRHEADLKGRVLRDKGGFLSPVVSVVDHEGRPAVLKDYRKKNAVTRGLLAPSLVKREFAVLKHLEGLPGIPKAYAIVEKRALLLEYIEGRTINKFKPGELPDRVFERLCETVRAMHARGVVHLDLRQRRNVLVRPGRHPAIVDFGSALCLRPGSSLVARLGRIDRSGVLKYKRRANPGVLTEDEARTLRKVERRRSLWPFS